MTALLDAKFDQRPWFVLTSDGTANGKPIGLFKTIADFSEPGHEAVRARLAQFLTPQRSTIDAINTTRGLGAAARSARSREGG